MIEKKLCGVNSYFKGLLKKIVCLSVCLTFFESADARDLGLMTLFFLLLASLCVCMSVRPELPILTMHFGISRERKQFKDEK